MGVMQALRFVCCIGKQHRASRSQRARIMTPQRSLSIDPAPSTSATNASDFDSFGPTQARPRSFWLRRRWDLSIEFWSILYAATGVQGLTEALDELSDCEVHVHSEYVQMHAGLVQILKTRKRELCRAITQIVAKEVPEAQVILEQLSEYDRILAGFKVHNATDVPMKGGQGALSAPAAVPKAGHLPRPPPQAGLIKAIRAVSPKAVSTLNCKARSAGCQDAGAIDSHVKADIKMGFVEPKIKPLQHGESAPLLRPLSRASLWKWVRMRWSR